MKSIYISVTLACLLMLSSCEYDNYEEPSLQFHGRIVYQGEPIHVSYNDVYFELWEEGWQVMAPINVAIDQDGSFSSLLFPGTYRMIVPAAQGPFRNITNPETNSDTIMVQLAASMEFDLEVMPYYMIRENSFSLEGNSVSADFALEQILTDENSQEIQQVSLFLSRTTFVDIRTSISSSNLSGADIGDLQQISLSTDIPEMVPAQNYVFARIGVQIQGVEDWLFSEIQRIDF